MSRTLLSLKPGNCIYFDPFLTRREMMKWGLLSTDATLGASALGQNLSPGNARVGDVHGRDAEKLFTDIPSLVAGRWRFG